LFIIALLFTIRQYMRISESSSQKGQKMHKHHLHALPTHNHPVQTEGNMIRWAHNYDRFVMLLTLGRAPALRRRTVELAQIQRGDRVLDVGCGTGDLTLIAKGRAGVDGQVAGIDPAPEMIAVARQKAAKRGVAIDYREGAIEALPFPDNSVDVVLSSLMMHHLPDALKTQGLTEIQRVLRPGGRLLIVDFQSATSVSGNFMLALLFHGGLQTGLAELPARMDKLGFDNINVGRLNLLGLGYLSAQANKKPYMQDPQKVAQ
jgi:ubiquinone/menaquinone biosynthesis C-methylase UbiE